MSLSSQTVGNNTNANILDSLLSFQWSNPVWFRILFSFVDIHVLRHRNSACTALRRQIRSVDNTVSASNSTQAMPLQPPLILLNQPTTSNCTMPSSVASAAGDMPYANNHLIITDTTGRICAVANLNPVSVHLNTVSNNNLTRIATAVSAATPNLPPTSSTMVSNNIANHSDDNNTLAILLNELNRNYDNSASQQNAPSHVQLVGLPTLNFHSNHVETVDGNASRNSLNAAPFRSSGNEKQSQSGSIPTSCNQNDILMAMPPLNFLPVVATDLPPILTNVTSSDSTNSSTRTISEDPPTPSRRAHEQQQQRKPEKKEVCTDSNAEVSSDKIKHENNAVIAVSTNPEKPFKCKKEYKYLCNYKSHYKIHTNNCYRCEFCGKRFGRKSNYKEHVRVHTGEAPYKCEFCGKHFKQHHGWKDHLRVHTGEKPYECDVCGRCFSVGHNLNVHKRIHTGERPFQCTICDKAYRQKSAYNSHVRNVHGIAMPSKGRKSKTTTK